MFLLKRTIAFLLVLSISFGQSSLIDNLSPKQIKSLKNNPNAAKFIKDNNLIPNTGSAGEFLNNTVKSESQIPDVSKQDILDDLKENIENDKGLKRSDLEDSKKNTEANDEKNDKTDLLDSRNENENFMQDKYFGYNIFKSNPDYFQKSTSETLDPDYLIGPGDEIIILLWGETEFQENHVVTKEGYIFVENLGQVFVNGLTLEKLEKKLYKLFSKVYSSLNNSGANASTFLDVSLGSLTLRSLRIFVLGEVSQPGAYMIKPNSTLFTSLYYFGGPTINGSLRNIVLIRSNKEVAKIDFYDFLLFGKQDNDLRLQKDDVIFIPKRGKTVSLEGEINNPLIYELIENESILDLVDMAGGLKTTAYMNHAQIKRIIPPEDRDSLGIERTIVDLNLKNIFKKKEKIKLFNEDIITINRISDEIQNVVTINGSVKRPGLYDFGQGLTVSSLVMKADGILGTTYLKKADISRLNSDNTKSYLEINLQKAINGQDSHNIDLMPGDVLTIYDFSSMKYSTDVNINGHVFNPGNYEFKKGMTVADLIFLGGGFENEDHLSDLHLERADLISYINPNREAEITFFRLDSVLMGSGIANEKLKMGDVIRIYSKREIYKKVPKFVQVEGFVMRPNTYPLYKDINIRDLLVISGGFEDSIHQNNMYAQRADLFRTDPFNDETSILNLELTDSLDLELKLEAGDILRVYSKNQLNEPLTVKIEGAVARQGTYKYKQEMSIYDLILDAGGVDLKNKFFRADINRPNPAREKDNWLIKTFILNNDVSILSQISKNNVNKDYLLKPGDIIVIRPQPIGNNSSVQIEGYVNFPGTYLISKPNETITDIIKRAGNVSEDAYLRASYIIRNGKKINLNFENIVRFPRLNTNFSVADGDTIYIGTKTQLVEVNGEVNSPGFYQFVKGKRYNDYIELAGGYTTNASRLSSFVTHIDGKSKKNKMLKLSPKIYDGTVITVGRKEDYEPFNFTEYVSTFTKIYADVTQAYLMLRLLNQ